MKPALLVVDVQRAFFNFDQQTTDSINHAIEYINEAIKYFREKQLPVVVVQHMNPEEELVPGVEGFNLPESLNIEDTDLHIVKTYGNAFRRTELEAKLREWGVDTVVVTGYLAEGCVLATYQGARDLDFQPIILRSAIASGVRENVKFVQDICDIITHRVLRKMLENC